MPANTARLPRRIQGRRWLVQDGDYPIAMTRFEAWGRFQARDFEDGSVVPIDAKEASRRARSGGDFIVDEITAAQLAQECGVAPQTLRRIIRTMTAEGRGRIARETREMLNRNSGFRSSTPPAGMADLLADALAVTLGPNAAVLRERPRDWAAIEAVAEELIKGG